MGVLSEQGPATLRLRHPAQSAALPVSCGCTDDLHEIFPEREALACWSCKCHRGRLGHLGHADDQSLLDPGPPRYVDFGARHQAHRIGLQRILQHALHGLHCIPHALGGEGWAVWWKRVGPESGHHLGSFWQAYLHCLGAVLPRAAGRFRERCGCDLRDRLWSTLLRLDGSSGFGRRHDVAGCAAEVAHSLRRQDAEDLGLSISEARRARRATGLGRSWQF
mmetsp:Transcript_21163/g.59080  ORF Transcript_21163/g.59080 Transcript_21163/m.59080 type:complete len:221 (+) Transcript_21163:1018-1680(+)